MSRKRKTAEQPEPMAEVETQLLPVDGGTPQDGAGNENGGYSVPAEETDLPTNVRQAAALLFTAICRRRDGEPRGGASENTEMPESLEENTPAPKGKEGSDAN